MLVLTREEVEELLDLEELERALARAHAELSAGQASLPPRIAAFVEAGLLGAMPGYLPSAGLGCKLVSLFPGNVDRPTHQAAIVLFDPENGSPLALMDGTFITATRTAGAAALAARLVSREDARVLAILGTGVQARAAVRAYAGVRDWTDIRVAGRDAAKAEELASEAGGVAASFEDAVRGADVVHVCTHSAEPVVLREWLLPGAHVGSVGFNTDGSELDRAIVEEATLVVESRESAFAPPPAGAPELVGVDPSTAAELGEIVSGTRPARSDAGELTLYKSVGVAIQDLAAASLVLAAAQEKV
jgi:alanine dehydrogenase